MTTEKFEQDGLVITLSTSKESATITWSGVSDARNPAAFLTPLTKQLLKRVSGLEVMVDFTKIEYMNSATIAPMINFVKALDAVGKPIVLVYADDGTQRTYMLCMRAIARSLKQVRVEGRAVTA